jgi:hypothetical protein
MVPPPRLAISESTLVLTLPSPTVYTRTPVAAARAATSAIVAPPSVSAPSVNTSTALFGVSALVEV